MFYNDSCFHTSVQFLYPEITGPCIFYVSGASVLINLSYQTNRLRSAQVSQFYEYFKLTELKSATCPVCVECLCSRPLTQTRSNLLDKERKGKVEWEYDEMPAVPCIIGQHWLSDYSKLLMVLSTETQQDWQFISPD